MKQSALWAACVATIVLLAWSLPVWGQEDNERPEQFPGVWYRISVDANGELLLGDGDGLRWYYHPDSKMYRMWFYNGPHDPQRRGYLEYHVYVKAVDRTKRTYVQVHFGWTTPEWSKLGRNHPPSPQDLPTASEEAKYVVGEHVYSVDSTVAGSVEAIRTRSINDYNPEWVCIGIVARNAYIYRGAFHECGPDASTGACCHFRSGACYKTFWEDCASPYEWLGAGTSCDQCIQSAASGIDFGDAPDDGYQTTLAGDGARHSIVQGVLLGRRLDDERDATPNATATGDDHNGNDDEDGIAFVSTLPAGGEAAIEVTAAVQGYLNAWVDFDADGRFGGPGEQIFLDRILAPGVNSLAFAVPADAAVGWTFARFRFNTRGLLDSFGPAEDGEVEDYYIQILANPNNPEEPDDPQDGAIRHIMDYRDNLWDERAGVWFWDPVDGPEVQPWSRMPHQDWGWTHDVSALVPPGATGVESATLTINAWDVDDERGEDDVIYVNNQKLGLLEGIDGDWQLCTFTLPADLLNDLWRDKKLSVYMDIDRVVEASGGNRVTLGSSTLLIQYSLSGSGETPTIPDTVPVYRFWSPVLSAHFYTTDDAERDWLISTYPDVWTYETIAYRALESQGSTNAQPVYRFWSDVYASHFYTLDEAEKQWLIDTYPDIWIYETIAFYAFAPGTVSSGAVAVYRFWSPVYGHHFYTVSEDEKQWLIDTYPFVWNYEAVAWYAYEP